MNNFEEQKQEYLERLSTIPNFVESLTAKDDEKSKELAKIILDPKDDKEIRFANYILDFTEDTMNFMEAAACGNVKSIPIEENEGIKTLVKVVKMIMNGEDTTHEALIAKLSNDTEEFSISKIANVSFGILCGFSLTSPEDFVTYISDELEFSFDNDLDIFKFSVLLNDANAKIKALQPTEQGYGELTDDRLNAFGEFVSEYHNLCKKHMKSDENDYITIFIKK